MCKYVVISCVVLFAATTAGANDPVMTLQSDKPVYEFGEPIRLTVTAENPGSEPRSLLRFPFERPGTVLLQITAPNGKRVESLREYPTLRRGAALPTIDLEAGASHVVAIDLDHHFPDTYQTGMPHNFDLPGRYSLRAIYAVPAGFPPTDPKVHRGSFQSRLLLLQVKKLEGPRLTALLGQLKNGPAEEKAATLALLRRGGAVSHIPNLMSHLDAGQPTRLRQEAANAAYALPARPHLQRYIQLLADDDPTVRGWMALALGKLGDRSAGDALVRAADPIKYPKSYASAFRGLIDIGDPRVPEVAARLERDAPSDAIRRMARQERLARESQERAKSPKR